MLQRLREHPAAPLYRNRSGNRLTFEDVDALRIFEHETLAANVGFTPGRPPQWLPDFVQRVFESVPHYKALGSPERRFEDLPTIGRGDLAADIAQFVPDDIPTDRLINFRTTGTTGHPLLIASHPVVAARYLAFHKRALRRFGVELTHGRDQVGVVLLGHQRKCFTYVSVTPLMDESGLAKINLHPDDWRALEDRARYLDALDPEVYAGDPISFATFATLPITTRPRALISVSMALSPGLRSLLETRFNCPVLDVYSLNEAGPVGVFDSSSGGHVLLQPNLYVEILDDLGKPVAAGERGEITLSGGFNFCLPLLRYRTGDFGALVAGSDAPVIMGLSGRQPVRYRTAPETWINNIDISHALAAVPASRFALHQHADGSLTLRLAPAERGLSDEAMARLRTLFGEQRLTVRAFAEEDKVLQYTSDLDDALLT
ncbi:MAG: capsule biosynthesis protein CapK [Gemmatimonadaceae bacterium]